MIYPLVEETVKRLNSIEEDLENDMGLDEWERSDLIHRTTRLLDQIYEYEGPDAITYDAESGRWRINSK